VKHTLLAEQVVMVHDTFLHQTNRL